jgi:hypothetical protein
LRYQIVNATANVVGLNGARLGEERVGRNVENAHHPRLVEVVERALYVD